MLLLYLDFPVENYGDRCNSCDKWRCFVFGPAEHPYSYIPIFDGTPANYKERQKRITIYAKKMELTNRKGECVLNLLGSLQGTAWKLVEDLDLEKTGSDSAFKDIFGMLDTAFQYDSKVEMPSDFSA